MKNIIRIFTIISLFGLMLIAANAQTLQGEWKLVEATSNGEKVVFSEEIKTTLSFGENNGMSGNSGCNRYSASYTLTEKKIKFGATISTKMACAGERMKQENTFFGVIGKTDRYKMEGEYLIFYDKSSRNVLKFEPVLKEKPQNEIPKC